MKKFKTRKKHSFIRIIITIIIIIIVCNYLCININKKVINSPQKYIKSLLNNNLNNQLNTSNNKSKEINPISLFNYNLSIKPKQDDIEKQTIKYIEKVNNDMKNPIVYIYNTHESEEYKVNYKYEYSIIPSVKLTSYILQEKLENLGINSIVETSSIKDILNKNNWVYRNSYKASRILLEEAFKNNNSLKYFIDIHRDSSNYDKTMIEIDNKKYAKVLFVVGLEHEGYEFNLKLAEELNNSLEEKLPGISRGISKKEGLGVNGIYNQDFNNNCILIEIGGVDNNILEVSNTINIFGDILAKYIKN